MTGSPEDPSKAVRLSSTSDRTAHIDKLAAAHGGRVGLGAVLGDLNRTAVSDIVPASAAHYGFRWNDGDFDTKEWWPQGITTSADAVPGAGVQGRHVVVVSWYAKPGQAASRGARLSFVDVTDLAAPRYRHVLLVQPAQDKASGELSLKPVRVHAGGIVWLDRCVLVADTHGGVRVFELDDILRIDGGYDGYRYALPQRTAYKAEADGGVEPLRWSFMSLDRGAAPQHLVVGEYGVERQTTRLVRFAIDAETHALATTDRVSRPLQVMTDGLTHMQGATTINGTLYISTSRGRYRRGSLWTRLQGESARQHKATLAVGPEDLTYWPQRDELWNVSEYPGHRYVYAMPRSAFA